MSPFESRVHRRRRLAAVTLADLESQMQARWEELQRTWDNGASHAEEERIYGAYLQVLDDWSFKKRPEGGDGNEDACKIFSLNQALDARCQKR